MLRAAHPLYYIEEQIHFYTAKPNHCGHVFHLLAGSSVKQFAKTTIEKQHGSTENVLNHFANGFYNTGTQTRPQWDSGDRTHAIPTRCHD